LKIDSKHFPLGQRFVADKKMHCISRMNLQKKNSFMVIK